MNAEQLPLFSHPATRLKKKARQAPALFDWEDWKTRLPELHTHSAAKLNVLRDYIEDYITILCTGNPGQNRFRLTLVDGFAGGGIYKDGVLGSPFVLLEAVKVAEARLNAVRTKPIQIECHFYFVEQSRAAFECLEYELRQRGFGSQIKETIFLICGEFSSVKDKIIHASLDRYSRGGSRVIFFLDQCGYGGVPAPMLREISRSLHDKAEFIVNIAIDWLTVYIEDTKTFSRSYPSLGLEEVLSESEIRSACEDPRFSPQYIAESLIGPAYKKVSGMRFFSPFYIQSPTSGRGYWLVHLAPQLRARSAMLDVIWRHSTGCRHYGHEGMNMLSFKPDANPGGYLQGMEFGIETKFAVQNGIQEGLARLVRDDHHRGISFQHFRELHNNETLASDSILERAFVELADRGEVVIHGKGGGAKRVDTVNATDIIKPSASRLLIHVPRVWPGGKKGP